MPKSVRDMFPEERKSIKHNKRATGALKIRDERTCTEMSSPRPLSSETYLANETDNPKSDTNWIKEPRRVIALARNAKPKTLINVERTFCRVRYIEPKATFEASSVPAEPT